MMNKTVIAIAVSFALPTMYAGAGETHVSDEVIAEQRAMLALNTDGMGFGPQSPRDIDSEPGENTLIFNTSPKSKKNESL